MGYLSTTECTYLPTSMTTVSNNLTKKAIDTWYLGPCIYPVPALEGALSCFFPLWKNGARKMASSNRPHIESFIDLPSEGKDASGHSLFKAGFCSLSKWPWTRDTGSTQPQG